MDQSDTAHATPVERAEPPVPAAILAAIRNFDTCTIANAIERFRVRMRNKGFTGPGLHCLTADSPRVIGYAATCKVRSAEPPVTGGAYADRTDWWEAIGRLPVPRIAVIQELDSPVGGASAIGEVHAAILKAFHCEGAITNGAVRDIPGIRQLQFPTFASAAAVSHSYMHIVEFGTPVEIFGLEIHSGDLLLADVHGVLSIPLDIAERLPAIAADIRKVDQSIVDLCQSDEFSLEKLLRAVRGNP
jgi:regulator of RNase E activity RraA